MKQLHSVLKTINTVVKSIMAIAIICVLLFSGYVIWDNNQIYESAENVRLEVKEAKPVETEEGWDFEELLAINPDVKLWLTLDGTEIDAPVVQGKDNYYYLNRDVFCKPSMAGALYLDSRNKADLSDIYNIIYGHHMKGSKMFGDLDYYLDEDFFNVNTTGTFLLPDDTKNFETVAVMQILDSTKEIFKPSFYSDDLSALCAFIEENALYINGTTFEKLKAAPGDWQITALVTCTNGSTGTRLVLLVMSAYDKPDRPVDPDHPDKPVDPDDPHGKDEPDSPQPKTGYDDHRDIWLVVLAVSGTAFIVTAFLLKRRRHKAFMLLCILAGLVFVFACCKVINVYTTASKEERAFDELAEIVEQADMPFGIRRFNLISKHVFEDSNLRY